MRRLGALCIVLGAMLILCGGAWLYLNETDEQRADAAAQQAVAQLAAVLENHDPDLENGADTSLREQSDGIITDDDTSALIKNMTVAVKLYPEDADEPVTQIVENAKTSETLYDNSMPVVIVNGVAYIGYLIIPEIGLELPVQADCTDALLKNAPCWYSGTMKNGDLVIAGHNYKRHFTPVKQLKQGARVIFRNAENNETQYSVLRTETIDGSDVAGMITSDDWDMTLFTCNYGGKKRVAVRLVIDEN